MPGRTARPGHNGPMPDAWPQPPYLDPDALAADAATSLRRDAAPRSPLAGWLGERVPPERLAAVEQHADLDPAVLARIRAYPVTPLLGATFEVADLDDTAARLQALLHERLPGIDWQVPDSLAGPLGKYLIVHTSLAAPPNEAVPEPMALELYAACVAVDGVPLDSAEGQAWYQRFIARDPRRSSTHALGRLRFELRAATCANVSYPGLQVPFYL
jgi:hypothetical protein